MASNIKIAIYLGIVHHSNCETNYFPLNTLTNHFSTKNFMMGDRQPDYLLPCYTKSQDGVFS